MRFTREAEADNAWTARAKSVMAFIVVVGVMSLGRGLVYLIPRCAMKRRRRKPYALYPEPTLHFTPTHYSASITQILGVFVN